MQDIGQLGPALFFMLVFFGIIFLVTFFRFVPIGLWITALASGVKVSLMQLVGMRFRKVVPSAIVNPLIAGEKAGIFQPVHRLSDAEFRCSAGIAHALVPALRLESVTLSAPVQSSVAPLVRVALGRP